MTNKYTSLELSRLIHSKVPNVETEKWWIWTDKKNPQIILLSTVESERWRYKRHLLFDGFHSRAYRLDDVLRAIQVWGEKQGLNRELRYLIEGYCKDDECNATEEVEVSEIVSEVEYHCHRLLTAYLADDGFDERTEEVIRSIFEV